MEYYVRDNRGKIPTHLSVSPQFIERVPTVSSCSEFRLKRHYNVIQYHVINKDSWGDLDVLEIPSIIDWRPGSNVWDFYDFYSLMMELV